MNVLDCRTQWNEGTSETRNLMIAQLIGEPLLNQCYISFQGKKVLLTPCTEEQKEGLQEALDWYQSSAKNWREFIKSKGPEITPEMRGKMYVEVVRWAMRHSDTPGGGWVVIEALAKRFPVSVSKVVNGWRVACGNIAFDAETMAVAACLVAIEVFGEDV